jgi:hypothetical protein
MKIIYEKYKNKKVKYPNCFGIVCGYCDDNILIATEQTPLYSFRKFGKDFHFIEEEFKNQKYRYCYVSENFLINLYGK